MIVDAISTRNTPNLKKRRDRGVHRNLEIATSNYLRETERERQRRERQRDKEERDRERQREVKSGRRGRRREGTSFNDLIVSIRLRILENEFRKRRKESWPSQARLAEKFHVVLNQLRCGREGFDELVVDRDLPVGDGGVCHGRVGGGRVIIDLLHHYLLFWRVRGRDVDLDTVCAEKYIQRNQSIDQT
jgi:hypothetical protein